MGRRFLCSFLALVILPAVGTGQTPWTVRAYGGLGIGMGSMAALADYANVVGGPSRDDRIEDFQTLFELNGGMEISIDENWSLGFDYASVSRTISTASLVPGTGWEFEPTIHMPTVIVRRLYESPGVSYGIGAGFGYHSGRLIQRFPASGSVDAFDGSGPGFMLQAVGYTFFDERFAGMIALDLRGSFITKLEDAAGRQPSYAGSTATLETYAIALRFALSYQR